MRKDFILLSCLLTIQVHAQKIAHQKSLTLENGAMQMHMPALAKEFIKLYKEPNKEVYWDNMMSSYLVAGLYPQSMAALDSMIYILREDKWEGNAALGIQFRAYALVKITDPNGRGDFATLYRTKLDSLYQALPEKAKAFTEVFFSVDTVSLKRALTNQLERLKDKDSISVTEARSLVRMYNQYNIMRQVLPLGKAFLLAQDHKNYVIQDSLLIPGADGAQLSAVIYRKKEITNPLPVVLVYNIYADPFDKSRAKEAAQRGYVGMVVNTRGKYLSPQELEPFEHDAKDAYAVLDWISKQPWCNGKIGMYGGSYLGFAQWSAVKKMHPALKTIVPQVAVAPGIEFLLRNGVFLPYMLQWIHYVTNNKLTDRAEFGDNARWDSLFFKWYRSGKSFRSLDTLDGRPNAIFQKWLQHPTFDKFWQKMGPYGKEFSSINIPVLTITGYFDVNQRGAFYYFDQHNKWNKNANHYLLVGPYDHAGAQTSALLQFEGYKIDSVANLNVSEIVWEWLGHFLKGTPFPKQLKDKVNYQVMGTNRWQSAPTLKTASNDSLLLYLNDVYTREGFKLASEPSAQKAYIKQEVSYTDRSVFYPKPFKPVLDSSLFIGDALKFISEPLQQELIMNGSMEGEIKLVINKKDVDLQLELFELMPDGKYFLLSHTWQRSSYVKDPARRILLRPGMEETIPIINSFFTSRKISKGNRLVLVVGMMKTPHRQLNYGTGKDVSSETIEDGKIPLQIQWSNRSYVKLPLWKPV